MNIRCWVHSFAQESRHRQDSLTETLASHGVILERLAQDVPIGPGVCICSEVTPELCTFLRNVSRGGHERLLVLVDSVGSQNGVAGWDLLQAGASDVLTWSDVDELAQQIQARFERWLTVGIHLSRDTQ